MDANTVDRLEEEEKPKEKVVEVPKPDEIPKPTEVPKLAETPKSVEIPKSDSKVLEPSSETPVSQKEFFESLKSSSPKSSPKASPRLSESPSRSNVQTPVEASKASDLSDNEKFSKPPSASKVKNIKIRVNKKFLNDK